MPNATMFPPVISVDSHTHILPLALSSKIRSFFTDFFNAPDAAPRPSCCSGPPPDGSSFAYPVDPAALVRLLAAEHTPGQEPRPAAWVLPYAHKPGMSSALNSSIRELCEELDGKDGGLRMVVGCTVHPADGEEGEGRPRPEKVLEDALRGGAKVAKLHCSVGDYDVLDVRLQCVPVRDERGRGELTAFLFLCRAFWELAEAARLPVVVHAGISVMGTTDTGDLSSIGKLCTRYPSLPLIIGARIRQRLD